MRSPEPNSSVTSDWPARDTECMRASPGTTPTASSTGRVTNCSTSVGDASGRSVRTVSDGYEMSGSRSTDSRDAATRPKSTTAAVAMNIVTGRRTESETRRMGWPSRVRGQITMGRMRAPGLRPLWPTVTTLSPGLRPSRIWAISSSTAPNFTVWRTQESPRATYT